MIRLDTIASLVSPYRKIADVGCDHGYLIKKLFDSNNIDLAYAIDNKIGPLSIAKENLKNYSNVKFFLSSGLNDVDDNIDCVIIAGMGGILIKDIIEANLEKAKSVKRIIVEANRDNYHLRKVMLDLGFVIEKEKNVIENGKYYEIDVYSYQNVHANYSFLELYYGPLLVKEKNDIFLSNCEKTYNKLNKIGFSRLDNNKQMLYKALEELLCK